MKKIIQKYIRYILAISLFIFLSGPLIAQQPTHYPSGDEPVEFNFINILIFFVVPVLLLVFYIYWLRSRKKRRKKEAEEKQ